MPVSREGIEIGGGRVGEQAQRGVGLNIRRLHPLPAASFFFQSNIIRIIFDMRHSYFNESSGNNMTLTGLRCFR